MGQPNPKIQAESQQRALAVRESQRQKVRPIFPSVSWPSCKIIMGRKMRGKEKALFLWQSRCSRSVPCVSQQRIVSGEPGTSGTGAHSDVLKEYHTKVTLLTSFCWEILKMVLQEMQALLLQAKDQNINKLGHTRRYWGPRVHAQPVNELQPGASCTEALGIPEMPAVFSDIS